MTISALKEIEMQFCQILRLCAVLMTKADKKVVIFFININVSDFYRMENDDFLSVLPHFARFSRNRTGG
ncbi:hypothetical protein ACULNC_06080 [Shigella flexneri]